MATGSIIIPPQALWYANANTPAQWADATHFAPSFRVANSTHGIGYWSMFLPLEWTSTSNTLRIGWHTEVVTTGDVRFYMALAKSTGETTDTGDFSSFATFDTENSVVDSHLGTTAKRLHICTMTLSNLDSAAAGDFVICKFGRDANHASDTLAEDVYVVSLSWRFTTT